MVINELFPMQPMSGTWEHDYAGQSSCQTTHPVDLPLYVEKTFKMRAFILKKTGPKGRTLIRFLQALKFGSQAWTTLGPARLFLFILYNYI